MSRPRSRRAACVASLLALLLIVSACSSSGSKSKSTGGTSGAATTTTASTGSGSSSQSAATTAAIATTKQYTAHPSPFPVDAPLPKALPAGTKFGFLQCIAPVCAQLAALMKSAVTAIHGQLVVVKGGASAQELQSAFASLLADHVNALLLPGIEPDTVAPQLAKARAAGIPMSSTGIMNISKYGIGASAFGAPLAQLARCFHGDGVLIN